MKIAWASHDIDASINANGAEQKVKSDKNNIILIGMPGAGKSTVGVILAKRLGYEFCDTDLVIQTQEQLRLQQIIDSRGLNSFRRIEAEVLTNLNLSRSVIATGGSAIYYPQGIANLRRSGQLVYLQVKPQELQQRIADMGDRGLVMDRGQSFEDLYAERTPLYQRYADMTIPCDGKSAGAIAAEIAKRLQ
jgi:shikimate kinase